MLIGIAGAARHGKDTIGALLRDEYGFEVMKFAEPLYELWKSAIVSYANAEGAPPREALVALGNTVRRHSPLFLVDSMNRRLHGALKKGGTDIVITDVRDKQEARFIKQCGGSLWKVVRHNPSPRSAGNPNVRLAVYCGEFDSGITDIDGLDEFLSTQQFDATLHNHSIDDLRLQVGRQMVNEMASR